MIISIIRVLLVLGLVAGFSFAAIQLISFAKDWCEATVRLPVCKPAFNAMLGLIVCVAAFVVMTELKRIFDSRRKKQEIKETE